MIIEFEPELDKYKELIEVINCFKTPPDFFYWLANDEIHYNPLSKNDIHNIREAVYDIQLGERTLCSIGGNLKADILPEAFRARLKNETNLKFFVCPEMNTFRHKIISHSVVKSNYTIFCEVYFDDICCGSGWEIFYLDNIQAVFNERKGNLDFEKMHVL